MNIGRVDDSLILVSNNANKLLSLFPQINQSRSILLIIVILDLNKMNLYL